MDPSRISCFFFGLTLGALFMIWGLEALGLLTS